MGTIDKDADAYDRLYPYVRDDLAQGTPLRAIDLIVDLWPEAITTPGMKAQALEWLREAITQAGGDADYFSRTYAKERDVQKAVTVACGHLFWMEARALYQDMQNGTKTPVEVYQLIQDDLRHAGRTAKDRRQHRFSQYSLTPNVEQTNAIRSALLAYDAPDAPPPPADMQALLRSVIEQAMQKHLRHAHAGPFGPQLGA